LACKGTENIFDIRFTIYDLRLNCAVQDEL
jgi:hypothetical protein